MPVIDHAKDPKHIAMRSALARTDVVCMLLVRRLFKRWRADDVVKVVNVYSDASPVVGTELQGMILDIIFRDGSLERLILPGSTLAYGHGGAISKGVALVWALWLVCGPEEDALRWLISKIRSFTTDFGVEMHLLEIPDLVSAVISWTGGTPLERVRGMIKPDVRLFSKAMRIAGWSHSLGGIMKKVSQNFPMWPRYLAIMRSLCKFLRNHTYRAHFIRKLQSISCPLDVSTLLKSFSAGFAKWRYETVFTVLSQLVPLETLFMVYMAKEMFSKFQDEAEFARVMSGAKDKPFWKWASLSLEKVYTALEDLRRWGMICDCEEHVEQRRHGKKKHIECPRIFYTIVTIFMFCLLRISQLILTRFIQPVIQVTI